MMGRIFNIASLIFAAMLACTMLLWLSAFVVNPWDHSLSVTSDFHVGIWGGFDGLPVGNVVFFNNKEYGPYRGSIITLSGDDGGLPPSLQATAWGPAYGVYYRHFHWLDSGTNLWTLMVSLAYPFALFSVLPVAWLWCRWPVPWIVGFTGKCKVKCENHWHRITTHRSFRLTATPNDGLPPRISKERYSRAITIALAQQAPILILASLILDGGRILMVCAIAAIASWICTAVILLRRPKQPTASDIALVKYGFWPAIFLVLVTGFLIQFLLW